jgi:hypothetical protein
LVFIWLLIKINAMSQVTSISFIEVHIMQNLLSLQGCILLHHHLWKTLYSSDKGSYAFGSSSIPGDSISSHVHGHHAQPRNPVAADGGPALMT